ncbi:MAG: S8 family serine peptidase [bacterium]
MKTWFTRMAGVAAVLALATGIFAAELSQQAANKLDARLRLLLTQAQPGTALAKTTSAALGENGASVRVFIKTSGAIAELRAAGVQLQSTSGDIATAVLPLSNLEAVANLNSVVYIEAAKMYRFHNDVGRVQTRANSVQQQFKLTGRGVIVGVLDSGIDWRHDDFRKANGRTRIKYLLDLSLRGGGPYGGTLYTEAFINDALLGNRTLQQTDYNGHGTHVTGSAAGNGRATSNGVPAETYAGVAPEADIVFVKSSNGDLGGIPDLDVIHGAVFIDSVAKVLGQPYVINLSLGGHEGAHDGTSLQEQALDNLVGPNKKGKAIVVSAGNAGQDSLHAGGNMNGTAVNVDFRVSTYAPNDGAGSDYVIFEGWYAGAANLAFRLTAPNGTAYGPVASGGKISQDTPSGYVFIDNASGGTNPLNGNRQLVVQIHDGFANKPPASGTWRLTITGNSGRYDLWLYAASMDAKLTSNISFSRLVAIPGTAKNVITVGAWVSKKSWTDLDNNALALSSLIIGSAAGFSSPGPSRDGRVKPEICAPGQMIGSSLSNNAPPTGQYSIWKYGPPYPNAFILRDNRHAIGNGTSFAAPLIAGGVALMLQNNPNLDAAQIRKALTTTATSDGFTGTVPNDKWGYGKADLLAALNYTTTVEERTETPGLPSAFALLDNYPNPFNPETRIAYEIPRAALVEIAVFDMLGRRVRTLIADHAAMGQYQMYWDGRNDQGQLLSSGVYMYKMRAGDFLASKKMVLLR